MAGGGTGGHFYPLIAVARALKEIAERERIVEMNLKFISDDPFDPEMLREEQIGFLKIPAGKIRRYFSFSNFFDFFKTGWGLIKTLLIVYMNFPDVIFSNGGYASFPTLFAAKFFRIPVVIHISDTIPGKTGLWASHFAKRISISFASSLKFFPESKTALTGNPIRKQVLGGNIDEAQTVFDLEAGIPVILVLGASQGAQKINDIILDSLSELIKDYQIILQTGRNNINEIRGRAKLILENERFAKRFHALPFLSEGELRNASKAALIVVARASAGMIFEISAWAKPAILVPLSNSAENHQRENAYNYARSGAAIVIEEQNLSPHILISEIRKLAVNLDRLKGMSQVAQTFSKIDAADKIAIEIVKLALEHA